MDASHIIQIIILVLLLALSAFFSSAETAYTSVNRIQLQLLAEEGTNKKAERALWILDHSQKMLSAILIGNNIVNLAASALLTTMTIELFGSVFVGLATGILTFLILIIGEITPKSIAVIKALDISVSYAKDVWIVMGLLTPVIFITEAIKTGIMRLFGIKNIEEPPMTEDELKALVDVGYEEGAIENDEFKMINNIFSLDDLVAKDIMVQRIDMTFVHIGTTYEELMDIYRKYSYTRYPVYSETTDAVIGTINMKDLLMIDDPDENFSVRQILREPHFTFEHKEVGNLLIEMLEQSINIIIVLDEYGATSGMITLEDILEEIVGEIHDEYDADEADPIKELHPGEYLIKGSTSLNDINEELGTSLESEEYDSLGGYLIEHLDRLPKKGETVTLPDGTKITAEIVSRNRVEKVHIVLPENASNE